MTKRLDILVHELDPYDSSNYLVRKLIPIWVRRGIACHVRRGVRDPRRADAVLLHVDLTRVPEEFLASARAYPVGINVAVADISKRRISEHIVSEKDGYDGPVIIKTNLNMGGGPEAVHDVERRRRPRSRSDGPRPKDTPVAPPLIDPQDYPVLDAPRHVPYPMWRDDRLVIEKFQPERRDGLYCLRQWIFLGRQEISFVSLSRHPVVKANRIVAREPLDEIPEALRERRRRLGFDFGKFDYAVVNGQPVLYDANRTPVGRAERVASDAIVRLAGGIETWLR